MTVTLNSELGEVYDTEIYVVDPSTDSLTAVLLTDINLPIFVDDAISITYNNTDGAEIGIQIILTN